MGFLLAIFLQAAPCMQIILFYCRVAFVVCKKWSIFVLSMVLAGISSLTLGKSQCISFGYCEPSTFNVTMHDKPIQWVHKLKYLACFFNHSCSMATVCRNFMVISIIFIGTGSQEKRNICHSLSEVILHTIVTVWL